MIESLQTYYEKLIAFQSESIRNKIEKSGLTEWESAVKVLTYKDFEIILDGYGKGRVFKADAIFNKLVAKYKLKGESSLEQRQQKPEKTDLPQRSQKQVSVKATNNSHKSFTNKELTNNKEVVSTVNLFVQLRDALSKRAKNILLYNDLYYYDDFFRFVSTDNNQFGDLRNCGKKTVSELDKLARLILGYEKSPSSILNTPVKDLGVSVRTLNSLIDSHIETLGELVSFEKADICNFYGLGEKSLQEIEEAVYSKGLWFGFDIKSVYQNDETKPQDTSEGGTINNIVATIEKEQDEIVDTSILNIPIEDLGLSARAFNCLNAAEIETLGDLVAFKKTDLLKFRNLGSKSVQEIEELIVSKGLRLGMNLSKNNTVKAKETQVLEPLVSKFPVFRLLSKYDLDYAYAYKEKFGHFPMIFLTYKTLGALSNREQDVLKMVWGLNAFSINSSFNTLPDFSSCSIGFARPKSINMIAEEFDISRQRTHQILQKATRRIRKIDKNLLHHDEWAYYGIVNDSPFLFSDDFVTRSISNERDYLVEYIRNGWGTKWMNIFLENVPLISDSYLCFFMFVKGMIPFWINYNEATLSRHYFSTDLAAPSFFVNNQLGHFAYERVIKETCRLKEVKKTEIVSVPIMSYFINDANYWNQNYRPTTIEKDNVLRLLIWILQTLCKVQIENNSIVFHPNNTNYCDLLYEILKTTGTRMHRDELFNRFMRICSDKGIPNKFTDSCQITPFLTRDSRIIPFGKSSYWGLKEWGELVGSIREITLEIVSKAESPIHINDLTKLVLQSRPDSNDKSISSIIRQTTSSGELVLFYGDFIGCPDNKYDDEFIRIPQSFDDWLQAYKDYVIKNKHLPYCSRGGFEGLLYRWQSKASQLIDLSSEEILKFVKLKKEVSHFPKNPSEYDFLQNCNLYKRFVENNMRTLTEEDDKELYCWFYKASHNYSTYNDNRNTYFNQLLQTLSVLLY